MYCPQCGQERISDATSFCSRCGYLLTGTAELMKNGGISPAKATSEKRSPRSRGVRQGVFMLLLMLVIAPIVGIILEFAVGNDPWPVGIAVLLLGGGGLLRIGYAFMFESKEASMLADPRTVSEMNPQSAFSTAQLPPRQDPATVNYISPSQAPEPLTRTPGSVTERTTRLLDKDPE